MELKASLLFLHIAGIVVWVGGMFFAYFCLRPVAAEQLQPPQRLPLWAAVFERFFPWVWAAVIVVLVSGLGMILQVGFARAPLFHHLMLGSGSLMMLIFLHVFFAPFKRLKHNVALHHWREAGAALSRIRKSVGINLVVGLVTIAIATLGRLLPN